MTKTKPDPEKALFDKIVLMPQPDRSIGEKIHAIVRKQAPDLTPRIGTACQPTPTKMVK